MAFWKNNRMTPAQIILVGFLALILTGTLLLMLPFASRDGGAPFLDALFTATSATCVTGLVVRDTMLSWTPFGQAVILVLIQIGGLGVVTAALAISLFTGRKIGLKERWIMQESIAAPQVGGILRMTGFILKAVFAMEATGALLLLFRFVPEYGPGKGVWFAVFHAVSAFCNAGFDLMGEGGAFSSITAYAFDPLVTATVALLIILGGAGFFTWRDILENRLSFRKYRLQTKLVLCVTAILLVGPFLFFAVYEFNQPQWAWMTPGQKLLSAAFQAVTPRTAGFNTVDLGSLSAPGRFLTTLLMLVGGSPGSTAGGFKTTTLAVLVLSVRAVFNRRASAQCFGRRLPPETFSSAAALFMLYLFLFAAGGMAICCLDGVPLDSALFESASAVGTVGLTIQGTGSYCAVSKVILIFLMYFGRVGGLTMIYAVGSNRTDAGNQFPQEAVTIG